MDCKSFLFQVWKTDLSLYRPRSWLIGYWLLASIIWFVFLVICFFHMRNGRKLALAMNGQVSNCMRAKSYSTEDLWNEDAYIPESYLPTPEYKVNLSHVQPSDPGLKRPTLMRFHHQEPSLAKTDEELSPLLVVPPPKGFENIKEETIPEDFDTILASLQSLASELEKDFADDNNCESQSCYGGYSTATKKQKELLSKSMEDLRKKERNSP